MPTIFENLLEIPLFQGISQEDFTTILGKTKLHFVKFEQGEHIIRRKAQAKELIFILQGEIDIKTVPENELYTYYERIKTTPYVIEPESLFGINPFFKSTHIAKTPVGTVAIDKITVLKELMKYDIFRLNLLNMISSRAYHFYQQVWKLPKRGAKNKIMEFLVSHAERPDGEKLIRIKMEDLADLIDETRLSVSQVLNELQSQGLIELGRRMIYIPEISKFSD